MKLPSWLTGLRINLAGGDSEKHFTIEDCSDPLKFTLVAGYFPPEGFSVSAFSLILKAICCGDLGDAQQIILNTGYESPAGTKHTFNDLSSECRLKFVTDLVSAITSNLQYAQGGFDPDVLNEFPAQRLIHIMPDDPEPVDWVTFWPACGGNLHGGAMVALKWDPVWWRISAFGLPVPPFQPGSGWDIEDVDRDEAESFGLMKPGERPPALKITVDLVALKTSIAALVPSPCSGQNGC